MGSCHVCQHLNVSKPDGHINCSIYGVRTPIGALVGCGDWSPAKWSIKPQTREPVLEPFRPCDVSTAKGQVWYGYGCGPVGRDGDCATEVRYLTHGRFAVSEYQVVPEDSEICPPSTTPVLKVSTTVFAASYQWAAAIGVQKIAEEGGHEEFVEELP